MWTFYLKRRKSLGASKSFVLFPGSQWDALMALIKAIMKSLFFNVPCTSLSFKHPRDPVQSKVGFQTFQNISNISKFPARFKGRRRAQEFLEKPLEAMERGEFSARSSRRIKVWSYPKGAKRRFQGRHQDFAASQLIPNHDLIELD